MSINDKVTACDMKKVPLANEAIDVAVLSLTLKPKRFLVTNGILMIAETTKSLKGRLSKLRDVIKAEGFETGEEDIIRLLAIHNKYHKTDKEFN